MDLSYKVKFPKAQLEMCLVLHYIDLVYVSHQGLATNFTRTLTWISLCSS